jgi:hypothetical protein
MLRHNISRLLTLVTATASAVAVTVALAVPALAAPPSPMPDPTAQLNTIIGNITIWVVGIAFGVASLFATVGCFLYFTAGGDPTSVEKAKSAFKNAGIGYAGVLLAPILLAIVRGWIGG